MLEIKKVSPLLDEFALGKPFSDRFGVVCYPAVHSVTNEKFILKRVSIPESQTKADALVLTGACVDRVAAQAYFEELAQNMVREIELLKSLSQTRGFAAFYDHQLTPKDKGQVGMDLWILSPYRTTLASYMRKGSMTHLEAVNLGIDLCAALTLCRKTGYLYQNLRPENVYITLQRKFQLGDLGLLSLNELAYASIPDRCRSAYTPPELCDAMAEPNVTMDIYALGMVLYSVYNEGCLPGDGDAFPGEFDEIPAPAHADEEMTKIILKAIAFKKEQRWQSPEEMGQALVAYMQRNPVNDAPIVPLASDEDDESGEPAAEQPEQSVPVQESRDDAEPDFTPEPELGFTPTEPELTEEELVGGEISQEAAEEAAPVEEAELADILSRAELFLESDDPEEPDAEEEQESEPSEPESDSESKQEKQETSREEAEPEQSSEEQPQENSDGEGQNDDEEQVIVPHLQPLTKGLAGDVDDEHSEEDDDDGGEGFEDKESSIFKKLAIALCVLVCLALAGMGGYYYYQNVYCMPIAQFEVLESTLDSITVEVQVRGQEDLLILNCQDNFGNAYSAIARNGQATFVGLQPNTQYMILLSVEGFHQLLGNDTLTHTTAIQTEITSFTAVTGAEDGSVILSFTPSGVEPEVWTVTYEAAGAEKQSMEFQGHSVVLTGLTVGQEYTFTLTAGLDVSGNSIYLSGSNTLEYKAMPVVTAQNLTVSEYTGKTVTLSWDTPETEVSGWQVRCYNSDGEDITQQTDKNSIVFEGLDSSKAYNFEVTAKDMTQSAVFAMTANPVFINSLDVDDKTTGKLTVSWDFAGNAPEKWLVMYSCNDDPASVVAVQTEEPTITIDPALPGAAYVFQLQPADGSTVFHGIHEVKTAEPEKLDAFGITAADIAAATFPAPENDGWTTEDISLENRAETFKPGDTIGFALEITSKYDYVDDEVYTLIVIRNEAGQPVDFTYGSAQWHTMWTEDQYLGELPRTPQIPGSYTLEVYFNHQLACSMPITIAE